MMFNQPQAQHEMILETIHPTGAEEWYCPTCGRRFLMQWPPTYNKVILDPGDESAIHSGGRGGVSMQSFQLNDAEEVAEVETTPNDPWLKPWVEWMESVNFEQRWGA